MGEYTETAYVGLVSEFVFGRQLFELVEMLHLPQPYFKGRMAASDVPGVERWEVRTIMRADATTPDFVTKDYTGLYPTWNEGVNTAMLNLLSRLCYTHYEDIPVDSFFRELGKRDDNGFPLKTLGNRLSITTSEKHMEDIGFYTVDMEQRVHAEMTLRDQARAVINTQTQELQQMTTLMGQMEEHIHELEVQNLEKDNQIAALQAQLNPPPSPPPENNIEDDDDEEDDDEDDEGGDDDAGDGAAVPQVQDGANGEEEPAAQPQDDGVEEEDPEEVIHFVSSDEEDSPAMNTRGKKRTCMNSRAYFKLFKK